MSEIFFCDGGLGYVVSCNCSCLSCLYSAQKEGCIYMICHVLSPLSLLSLRNRKREKRERREMNPSGLMTFVPNIETFHSGQ